MVNNEKELRDFLTKKTDVRTANVLLRGGFLGKAEYPIQEKEIFMALKKALDSDRLLTLPNLGKKGIAKIRQAVADFENPPKSSEENYEKLIGAILGIDVDEFYSANVPGYKELKAMSEGHRDEYLKVRKILIDQTMRLRKLKSIVESLDREEKTTNDDYIMFFVIVKHMLGR